MVRQILDVQGLLCPLPVLKAKKQLRLANEGDFIEVLTTDPGAIVDFQCLSEEDGIILIEQSERAGVCTHVLKKGAPA